VPKKIRKYGIRRSEEPVTAKRRHQLCDCVVRSLAGPEPDRQVFAKFKHLSRKAAARSSKTIYVTIGEILEHLRPPNAPLAMPNP
jgi:hypothetical protein